jgi:PAS domain S-box-containing protein
MKIKTKLYISLYLSVCTMLVVMMALYWSYRKHNKADENEGLVVEIQKAIFERTILRDEYILYHEERAKSEWQKKSEYAGRLMDLASKRFKDDMSKAILDEMHGNYDNTVAVFSKIVENRERKDLNEKEKALSSEYEDRLISQILLKAYALSGTAQRLLESSRRKSEIALKFSHLLTFIFVVALMISILTNSVLLNRILSKRLGTIHKGTKIIGSGNLDYRIDLRSKDEFEDLSNEFNAMGDKLKKSFVSVENLEKEIIERKRTEEALRESEERSRSLIETSPDVIVLIDFSGKIIVINEAALTTYGYESRDELIGRSVLDFVIPEDRPRVLQEISKVLGVKTLRNLEFTSLKKDGSTFPIEVSASLILDAQQKPTSIVIMIRDITERKKAEEEREKLIHELQDALGKIKTLSGLLPICSWCKKIRDDEGYWNQIETYIGDHSEAEFTHSICPECMKKHHPDFADNKNKEVIKENIK